MNTRKSNRNKVNRFEDLGEAVDENKDSALVMEPSSVTGDSDTKPSNPDSDFKESFLDFQNKINSQFSHVEYTFCQLTDYIIALRDSSAELH